MNLRDQLVRIEKCIIDAIKRGILIDKRSVMPRGEGCWPKVDPDDRLGICIHQNGSKNFRNPKGTASYHTSKNNHITPGKGLPTIVYPICIPDNDEPANLTGELLDRTYAQSANDDRGYPGDENTHLIPILVMGGFRGVGYRGYAETPTHAQVMKLERVVEFLQFVFDFTDGAIFCHADFGKAACPGYFLTDWVEEKRQDTRQLITGLDWQEALLSWDATCLPIYGADGCWGGESKSALASFQRDQLLRVTAMQDPFTELVLLKQCNN